MVIKRSTLRQVAITLVICLDIGVFSGCADFWPKPLTPIYAINSEELNFVQTIYDSNDPNKVLYYEICTDGKHTGAYLSNRVLKQIFKVDIK